jgi:hypothetical protein
MIDLIIFFLYVQAVGGWMCCVLIYQYKLLYSVCACVCVEYAFALKCEVSFA